MTHKGTVRLETERLILREFSLDDADSMFKNWAGSKRVTKFLTWPPYQSANEVWEYLRWIISGYENPKQYNWCIELKEVGQIIGNISVVRYRDDIGEADIGYCLSEKYWHKGIMTEAFKKVIDFLFTEVGIERIMSEHDPKNPRSGAVMKKCGLQYEGTLRHGDRNNEGICDSAVYSILRNEYRGGV